MTTSQLPGLDLDRLSDYVERIEPGLLAGPLRGDMIAGGRSNLTYAVTDGVRQWVVRRPPLGHVLATAHDVAREYRVMSALGPTAVPVPSTVLLCTDPDVLGAPFYIMEQVEGTVYRHRAQTETLPHARNRAMAFALIDVLAGLHTVDPAEVGLGDFGRPDGFLRRQVRRWKTQLDASRCRDVPGLDELHDRLAHAVPATTRHTIVHGDYRLDNVIVDEHDHVAAVLDWEMATLGDPLTDLGLFTAYWEGLAGLPDNPISGAVSQEAGFPPAEEMIARYAARSGADVSNLDWYLALAYFKLAVILEGIHFRFQQGKTVGDGFDQIGALVAPIVAKASAIAP